MSGSIMHGGCCDVPSNVAKCPECDGHLYVRSHAWDEETGSPIASDLQIDCEDENSIVHRYWQSDWQPVRNAIGKWCGAVSE